MSDINRRELLGALAAGALPLLSGAEDAVAIAVSSRLRTKNRVPTTGSLPIRASIPSQNGDRR